MLCTDIVRAGWTDTRDEFAAVQELYDQIGMPQNGPGFFFCSPDFDPERLARALNERFEGRMVGCTTAGEITPAGYRRGTLTGFVLDESTARVQAHLLTGLDRPDERVCAAIGESICRSPRAEAGFGLLLVDGLSLAEDRLLRRLRPSFGDLPVVGGSAGDCLEFRRSQIFCNGRFLSDAAVFCHVATSRPVHAFRTHHFEAADRQWIVTRADVSGREVLELNGRPAAQEYAAWAEREVDELQEGDFARRPLMIRLGREGFVRSIQQVTERGGLRFYCPMEAGIVVNATRSLDLVQQTQGALAGIHDLMEPDFIIGFDSVLRRLELAESGQEECMGEILVENRVVGFNTYGEQQGAFHINQSLTGLAIGR